MSENTVKFLFDSGQAVDASEVMLSFRYMPKKPDKYGMKCKVVSKVDW